jgi:hypothetical protein
MADSSSRPPTAARSHDALRRLVDLLAHQAARELMASSPPTTAKRIAPHYSHDIEVGPRLALSTSTCT